MKYIVTIILLLIPAIMIGGLVYAYKKLPRVYFFLLLFALIAAPYAAFKSYEKSLKLSAIPDALHVDSISYSKEESGGFGQGSYGAGVMVYPLHEDIADEISRKGIEFFNNLPLNKNHRNREWHKEYEKWYQTPIEATNEWKSGKETGALDIYDYICIYWFCPKIDDAIVKQAAEIVNSEGGYYAYGQFGLIVVSPDKKLVLYMYRARNT
jgi:hypothetical protein